MTVGTPGPVGIRQGHNHIYRPRGSAIELFNSRAEEVLVTGPMGTGKSRACMEKLHIAALKYPGMRGLIVRKTLNTLSSTALVEWRESVAFESLATGKAKWYGGSLQESAQFKFQNGSTIVLAGLDNPTKIMSSEYDMIYVCEAIELRETEWELLTTRLRHGRMPYQQILADCNPASPMHWLKQRCNSGQTLMLKSSHEENPRWFHNDGTLTEQGKTYISKLDALTGFTKLRNRYGQWVQAEGSVYENYDPSVHVIPAFKIPDSWSRYWVIDWGYTNPFTCQFWAEDEDGRLYLYREIYWSRRVVEDHVRHIKSLVQKEDGTWKEPQPTRVITDHDSGDRAVFERHMGLSTKAALKDKSTGYQSVEQRFKVQGDGKARLYLLENALVESDPKLKDAKKPTCLEEELPGLVWDTKKDGSAPEEAVKLDDHGCDALRYMVAERDLKGINRVRFVG